MSNSVLNKLFSDSIAFEASVQGSVTIFNYEGDMANALIISGFVQCTAKDSSQFGREYKTNQYFNERTKECVFLDSNRKTFTVTDTNCNPL